MTAVVAVAGHVDHGKSALVTAMTGRRTDRLVHEQAARHTIEVLPAHLPDSSTTLLDVPGHADWLTATLAGLGAATHALLVVAADDGIMPQTRDHLAGIRALDLPLAAVAISRADLVADRRVQQVVATVRRAVCGDTTGTGSRSTPPVIATSTVDERGLADLGDRLATCRADIHAVPATGPDLWVDTSFHVPGRGLVAIGTLRHGTVHADTWLAVAGTATSCRVRGLEQRGNAVSRVRAPARLAVAVAGVDDLSRGTRLTARPVADHGLVAWPVAAEVSNLSDHDLRGRGGYTLHVGSATTAVGLRRVEGIAPGSAGIATIATRHPVPVRPGDRFVLRDTGRRQVVGGGMVLCPARPGSGDRADLDRLATALVDDVAAIPDALAVCHGGVVTGAHVTTVTGVDRSREHVVAPGLWRQLVQSVRDTVTATARARASGDEHEPGVVIASLCSRLAHEHGVPRAVVRAVTDQLVDTGHLQAVGPLLLAASADVDQQASRRALRSAIAGAGLAPPPIDDLLAGTGADRGDLHHLVRAGDVHIAGRHAFDADTVTAAGDTLASLPAPFTVADARDALAITRRHAVPLLELTDRIGLTIPDDTMRRRVPARDEDRPTSHRE